MTENKTNYVKVSNITYVKGDVTKPIDADKGNKILVHCVNDCGKMGAGVALAIARKWPSVKKKYVEWHRRGRNFGLGKVQFVKVEDDIVIGNMIGQHGIRSKNNQKPIR